MKKKLVIGFLILLLAGGCNAVGQKDISEMDSEELPDVIAFQDDFTREFMTSTEEVEDGYYLFESKTGGYTMMYPENAKLDEIYFEMPGEDYEGIQFGENEETNDYHYFVRSTYNAGERASDLKALQSVLSAHSGYEGEFESMEYDDKTIHFATSEYDDKNGEIISHNFLGIIMSNHSDQSVSMAYMADIENADINSKDIREKVMKIMKYIEFNSDE